MNQPENRAGFCKICGEELLLGDPKRIASDGSFMICPIHAACKVRPLLPLMKAKKITLIYIKGS